MVSSRRFEGDLVAGNNCLPSLRFVKEKWAAGLIDAEVPRGITPVNTQGSAPTFEVAVAERRWQLSRAV